jgi:hypothetical protein
MFTLSTYQIYPETANREINLLAGTPKRPEGIGLSDTLWNTKKLATTFKHHSYTSAQRYESGADLTSSRLIQ